MKIGIIGCGALGLVHARRFGRMDDVRVMALSDPRPEAMERAAAELPHAPDVCRADDRDILGAGLDAVCIASPDGFHVRQVLDAFSAGLHVLCEKPLTLDPIELQTIIDARDRSERVLALTYIRHYDSGVRRMREEIQSGKWGEVRRTAVYYAEDWLRSNIGTWRHQPDLCPGGVIYDAACHQLDALLWTTGLEPEWAHATIDCCGTEVPIAAWGTGSLAGGVPLTFCLSGDAHIWREQVNVHCDATEFVLDNSHTFQVEDGKLRPIQQDPSRETPDAAFVKHLRSEGPNWAPAEAVRPLMRLSRMILGMDV